MKHKAFSKNLLISCIAAAIGISQSADAKTLKLYKDPNSSEMVAEVDAAKGVISIFTSKDKNWLKVADPSNGNVGWVKADELGTDVMVSTNLYSTSVTNNGRSMVSFGQPSAQMLQFMRAQQQEMAKFFNTNDNFPFFDSSIGFANLPMMSIFIMPPDQGSAPSGATTKTNSKNVL